LPSILRRIAARAAGQHAKFPSAARTGLLGGLPDPRQSAFGHLEPGDHDEWDPCGLPNWISKASTMAENVTEISGRGHRAR